MRKLPRPLRIAALDAALAHADPSEREPIAIELAELALPGSVRPRHAAAALAALLRCWDALPRDARLTARAVGRSRWSEALRTLEGHERHSRALCSLIHDTADPSLLPALDSLLHSDDSAIRDRASLSLLAYVRTLRPELSIDDVTDDLEAHQPEPFTLPLDPASDPDRICGAIAELAWRYADHRCRWALIAVLLVAPTLDLDHPDPERAPGAARLARLLDEPTHPAGSALRGTLRRARSPAIRAAAWRLLAHPGLEVPSLERVAVARTVNEHRALLELSHLALRPARARHLSLITLRGSKRTLPSAPGSEHPSSSTRANPPLAALPAEAPLPDRRTQARLPARARRGIPTLACRIDLDHLARPLVLEPLLADPDPHARLASLKLHRPPDLLDYTLDAHPAVARSAVLRACPTAGSWAHSDPDASPARSRRRIFQALTRSAHPSVRRDAALASARTSPWDPTSPASRILARARLASRSSERFLAELRRRILSGPASQRLEAITLTRALRIAPRAAPELIAAARAPSSLDSADASRVASAAAASLAHVPTEDASRALTFCLSHADHRVRANAVEALAARARATRDLPDAHPTTFAVLVELKSDDHHRVRANALRGLLDRPVPPPKLYEPDAIAQLVCMLEDDRPAHRLSALWLLDRLAARGSLVSLGSSAHTLTARASELARAAADTDHQRDLAACGVSTLPARASRTAERCLGAARAHWLAAAPSLDPPSDHPVSLDHHTAHRVQDHP